MKTLRAIAIAALLSTTAIAQNAAFTTPQTVPADLARIDASLNATRAFQGRFTQIGADGSQATGTVYIQRPGKLRFEYDAPSPLLVVSDGVTFAQADTQLETMDRVPLSATPLNYFLKSDVNLAEDVEIVGFRKVNGEWQVSARDGSGETDGTMTMVFDAATLALKAWIIDDDFGQRTSVYLSDLSYNPTLDPRLFILRDEPRRDRRRR